MFLHATPLLYTVFRYVEDEYPSGHSAIWGSYYDRKTKEWGYACCQATTFSAYCTNTNIKLNKNSIIPKEKSKKASTPNHLKRQITVASKPSEYFENEKKRTNAGYLAVKGVVASQTKKRVVEDGDE